MSDTFLPQWRLLADGGGVPGLCLACELDAVRYLPVYCFY